MSEFDVTALLGQMLDDYPLARYEPRSGNHPLVDTMRALREAHRMHLEKIDVELEVRASTGRGATWANVPWIALLDAHETDTAQDGRYVSTLFAADGSAIVTAIVWGTQRLRRERGKEATQALSVRRRTTAELLTTWLDGFEIDRDVDLRASTSLAKDYERSCLAWRRFERDDIDADEAYWRSIEELIAANSRLIEHSKE